MASNTEKLISVLGKHDRITIVLHDNPDPDAVSSALALSVLCEKTGTATQVVARGTIGFEENRILLEELGTNIKLVDEVFMPESDEGIALLDNAVPGENNPLPPGTIPNIVIDHHSTAPELEGAEYVEICPARASTSSIMTDHLRNTGVELGAGLASGLFYGLMVDSHSFVLNMSGEDYDNMSFLGPKCNSRLLGRLERPPLDVETLDVLGRAIQNREINGGYCLSWVDYIQEQDAIARAGDFLIRQKGVHTTLVYGIMDDHIYVSARTQRDDMDLGGVLRDAFRGLGFAGGHTHAAGARIPVGILGFADFGEMEEKRTVATIVKRAISSRFLDTVGFLE